MILRKRALPHGWYPASGEETRLFLDRAAESIGENPPLQGALACMVPHAGWYFSGALAARGVYTLDAKAETVVVLGGHLPASCPVLYAEEDGAETPLGVLEMDGEFRGALREVLGGQSDRGADNTVEIQLPLVKYFFPNSRLLHLRLPAGPESFEAGKAIGKTARALARKTVVIASTDLTHYGPNYGFTPKGLSPQALDWVKKTNDAAFIASVISGEAGDILARAEEDRSACSVGAVLGALGFAHDHGARNAVPVAYGTSADRGTASSFVGYGVIAWYS
ncbi:MAG: AmmeMemoRadiSam system protein B [Spirochaetaceae bacterium]|nr:AmmeMemoRadiSam system protein B [Spirochaetaceae bacterium]